MDGNLQKQIKLLRTKKGLSQELLAEETKLSLRTIQRIENGESVPRGDTLKKLATALDTTPDSIIDWRVKEDKNLLIGLNLSQMVVFIFPIMGLLAPLLIWIYNRDKVKYVNEIGKSILNFQLAWNVITFSYIIIYFILSFNSWIFDLNIFLIILLGWNLYNFIQVIINTFLIMRNKSVFYFPVIRILN